MGGLLYFRLIVIVPYIEFGILLRKVFSIEDERKLNGLAEGEFKQIE